MQTAGKILKNRREEKNLTLAQIEKEIRIKKKFLKFIEEEKFEKLPSATYAEGFVKNYARFLELPSEKVLAVFRRQFKPRKSTSLFKKLSGEELFLRITPRGVRWGIVFFLLFLFFGYLLRQLYLLSSGPSLLLFEPRENLVVHQAKVVVRGKTEPGARVFINNEEVYLNQKGEFSEEIFLSEGINEITVLAKNQMGKRKRLLREVTFEPL